MAWVFGRRSLRGLATALVGATVALQSASAWASDAHRDQDNAPAWRVGEVMPIEARDGRSIFQAPEDPSAGDLLVVVSSLSPDPGPFRVEFETKAIDQAAPPPLADDGPPRAPALAPFHPSPTAATSTRAPLAERPFHMMVRDGDVGSPSNYLAVQGVLKAVGRHVQVYVAEEDLAAVGADLLADVVSTFDDHVYPVAARSFGLAEDVDGDGRFTILISSWLSRLGDGKHSVDGYVRVTDLDESYPAPFGNRCDMMYLSASLRPGPHLRSVMAHEYAHAVMFTRKYLRRKTEVAAPIEEESWLDEGVAHLIEDVYGFGGTNLDHRVSAFLSRPERYRLVVDDYYAADLFRGHGNRGSAYLFLRWCADRFGPNLPSTLMESPLQGIENLEAATGRTFAELYRGWSSELFLDNLNPESAAEASPHNREAGGEDWFFAGPRYSRAVVGDAPEVWTTAGTSSRFMVVEGSGAGAVEVRVSASESARLQVSAVRLPRDLPKLSLNARAHVGLDGDLMLRATVRERSGHPVKLLAMAWELLVPPPDPRRSSPQPGRLADDELTDALGGDALAGGDSLYSKPIRLTGFSDHSGPVVLKLMGVDSQGRRVSAWASLNDEAAPSRSRQPLAGEPPAIRR